MKIINTKVFCLFLFIAFSACNHPDEGTFEEESFDLVLAFNIAALPLPKMEQLALAKLSGDLLYSVKLNQQPKTFLIFLSRLPESTLREELHSDQLKKTFWINIYNAFFQILRKKQNLKHPEIFRKKTIDIAGKMMSLDDIEHGILRRFKWKFSLGYVRKPFVDPKLKALEVKEFDYRIHFALNCGAESCPPIAFYKADKIEVQLELATESFVLANCFIDEKQKKISISKLFLWYRADFGSRKGIKKIVGLYFKKDLSKYYIRYEDYSWKEHLDNFQE